MFDPRNGGFWLIGPNRETGDTFYLCRGCTAFMEETTTPTAAATEAPQHPLPSLSQRIDEECGCDGCGCGGGDCECWDSDYEYDDYEDEPKQGDYDHSDPDDDHNDRTQVSQGKFFSTGGEALSPVPVTAGKFQPASKYMTIFV